MKDGDLILASVIRHPVVTKLETTREDLENVASHGLNTMKCSLAY